MTVFQDRVPAGVPTGGQFATSLRHESGVDLTPTETLTLTNGFGRQVQVEYDTADPLANQRLARIQVASMDRPDLANALAEAVLAEPDDEWGFSPAHRDEHRTVVERLVGNPAVTDENFIALVAAHERGYRHLGQPTTHPFHQAALASVAGRGEAAVTALCRLPYRPVMEEMATRPDLTAEQVALLTDPGEGTGPYPRLEWLRNVAASRETDYYNPKVLTALTTSTDRYVRQYAMGNLNVHEEHIRDLTTHPDPAVAADARRALGEG